MSCIPLAAALSIATAASPPPAPPFCDGDDDAYVVFKADGECLGSVNFQQGGRLEWRTTFCEPNSPYTPWRSLFETSRAAGYSHLGSVVWAGQGSVGFTPRAGRGSGRALCGSVRAGQYGRAGQGLRARQGSWGHNCRAEIRDLRW